jgi:tRNA-splicing ligase RtcB
MIKFVDTGSRIPIKSWCANLEAPAFAQATNMAKHPKTVSHVALMPDAHSGYGLPVGGVIACDNAVIPYAVGVDIGCGMVAFNTKIEGAPSEETLKKIMGFMRERVPMGEGHAHEKRQEWDGFDLFFNQFINVGKKFPPWCDEHGSALDQKNLGTLGGGNHFCEIQLGSDGNVWLMIHSGSRNMGQRICKHYNDLALKMCDKWSVDLPSRDSAFLLADEPEGIAYIRDMNFALEYAKESRRRMMIAFIESFLDAIFGDASYEDDIYKSFNAIDIHHNYASLENHFGRNLWIHRKGATSARVGQIGVIPGSMGTSSYIVAGLGNPDSFMSCSHGAGRAMSRTEACETLKVEDCDKAMEGVIYGRWGNVRARGKKDKLAGKLDLSEAPQAYKDIDAVMDAQRDLVEVRVKLKPLAVMKG